jgi:hypothetical protein
MTHKYDKVEGMTVGQVVDAMMDGVHHYVKYDGESHAELFPEDCDCLTIKTYLDQGRVYRKIETPWWEKHVDGLVMVRDKANADWTVDKFKEKKSNSVVFWCENSFWYEMRPLTAEEKDAIITEG